MTFNLPSKMWVRVRPATGTEHRDPGLMWPGSRQTCALGFQAMVTRFHSEFVAQAGVSAGAPGCFEVNQGLTRGRVMGYVCGIANSHWIRSIWAPPYTPAKTSPTFIRNGLRCRGLRRRRCWRNSRPWQQTAPSERLQDVEVPHHQGALGGHRGRRAVLHERLQAGPGEAVAPLRRLVGVGRRAHRHPLPAPGGAGQLPAQHGGDVPLDEDPGAKVLPYIQIQKCMRSSGVTVGAGMFTAPVRVKGIAEGHSPAPG